jgi:ABC-type transport system involved in multi-copper enzyme maturation permease subunit
MDSIWSKLDRKATAIAEFTIRQYRTRISTWAVMIAGILALSMLVLFYIDGLNTEFEAIDNDGDSIDHDSDGYPTGQEIIEGTDPFSAQSFPVGVTPDPASKWINEDDFDWDAIEANDMSQGYDDDGDCRTRTTSSQRDQNDNNIECDVYMDWNIYTQEHTIYSDGGVDEDPDENLYGQEAQHRAFVLGIGKFGIVYMLGIMLPLFLATGLIREEMSSGTMHYMLAKPIARGEVLLYRMIGYIGVTWPYIMSICLVLCLITGFAGPGESIFRWSDIGIWMSISLSAMLVSLVYGTIFCGFGILWKNGVILALLLGVWELGMAFVAIASGGDSPIKFFSVIGWGLTLVDSATMIFWPDNNTLIEVGLWGGGQSVTSWFSGEERFVSLPAAEALSTFSGSTSGLSLAPWASAVTASLVLIIQAAMSWFIGQIVFKSKEID